MPDLPDGWIYETGIGENRAILIEQGSLVRACVERATGEAKAGAVMNGKFVRQWVAGASGIVILETGQECLLQPLPKGLTEGSRVKVEIVRQVLSEKGGRIKRAKARPAAPDVECCAGEELLTRIKAEGKAMQHARPDQEDLFAQHGWHEVIEQAETGHVEFEGGCLHIAVTSAMTVIDVDGSLPPFDLAKKAAKELALALRRLDITGNIGVDFPTLESKSERGEVCRIFDDHMITNCERTAINGFGFMQIVSRKVRPSTMEIIQGDKLITALMSLLRQAERDRRAGVMQLEVHPGVAVKLKNRPHLLEELAKRLGREVEVRSRGDISISGGQISAV